MGSITGLNNKQSVKGFSLLEILIALALFGMIFVCLVQVIIAGHFAIRQGDELVAATNAAKLILERTRQLNFKEIPETCNFKGSTGLTYSSYFPPKPYPSFDMNGIHYTVDISTAEVTVAGVTTTTRPLRRVTTTISWESKDTVSYGQGNNPGTHTRSVTISNVLLDW